MPRSSRVAVRWFAAGFAAAASVYPMFPALAGPAASPAAPTPIKPPRASNSLRSPCGLPISATPIDRRRGMWSWSDTSASQVGEHRDRALAVTAALLAALPADAQVALFALDTRAVPLSAGFIGAHSAAATTALETLNQRAPLGATDLALGLRAAGKAFGNQPAGSILYIGDGMSAANLLRSGELQALTDSLRTRQIPVSSFAVGPDQDWRLLGVLAHQTGGVVEIDSIKAGSIQSVAARLATAAAAPVLYPDAMQADGGATLLTGGSVPPLRGDRETIVPGRGEVPQSVQITAGGRETAVAFNSVKAIADQPAVRALALAAERSGGLEMPAAGSELFALAGAAIESNADQLATAGDRAVKGGNVAQAQNLLAALDRTDPAGRQTVRLRQVVAQLQDDAPAFEGFGQDAEVPAAPLAGPGNAAPPAPVADGGQLGLLDEAARRERVLTQQTTIQTNSVIDQARQIRQTDPADALNLLKRYSNQIRLSTDIDPEARRQLLRRLENEIQLTANAQEKLELDLTLRQERLAQLQAEDRMVERMLVEDEKLDQLIARIRALIDAGYHGDDAAFEQAIVVSNAAVNLRPGNGPATAALFTATAADQLNKIFRLRGLRDDRFLETLYQVELSHVPFPDEPPIIYPAPEVWQALSERRKKYNSVSLESTSPAEERIRAALNEETNLEFPMTPLRDAIAFLAVNHDINIIFDKRAIEEFSVDADQPVDIVLNGITLRSALKILLEPFDLTYVIEDEVMKITHVDIANEKLQTRVYPVGDLVIPIISLGGGGGLGGGTLGGQGGGLGGQQGGGQGGFGGGQGGGGGIGIFSVPNPNLPGAEAQRPQRARGGRNVPQTPAAPKPVDDAELRGLLDGLTTDATPAGGFVGQAFAAVDDDAAKKKLSPFGVEPQPAAPTAPSQPKQPQAGSVSAPPAAVSSSEPAGTSQADAPLDAAAKTPEAVWDDYFAKRRPDAETVRQLVLQLHAAGRHAHTAAAIRAALRHGQGQPWMYEVLALTLQLQGAPAAEVERALLSAVDFAATDAVSLMTSAAYLTRFQAERPALRLYRQASDIAPERPEPYVLGLKLSEHLRDDDALLWAARGTLTTAWGKDHVQQHRTAENAVRDRAAALAAEGESDAAGRLLAGLAEAKQVDLQVRLAWSGPGDLDVTVREPGGTVCSIDQPRTSGGGVLTHDGHGPKQENCFDEYICAAGFPGVYRIEVRHAWGEIVGKRAKLVITRHRGTPHESTRELTVPVTDDGSTVRVSLTAGRRDDLAAVIDDPAHAGPAPVRGSLRQLIGPLDPAALAAGNRFQQSLFQVGGGGGVPGGLGGGGVPGGLGGGLGGGTGGTFAGGGAVGFQPGISIVSEGISLNAAAVVSADRRYVRLSLSPNFSNITDVFTFQFFRN